MRGEGSEAQRLLAIASLQSLLVISLEKDPHGLGGSHVQPTDSEKAWCESGAQKVSATSEGSGILAAHLGTGSHPHTIISLMFRLSGFLLSRFLKHWTCHCEDVGAFKNPRSGRADTFHCKTPAGGWSVWGPVRICERFLEELFVRRRGVPVWEQNAFKTLTSSKPSNFLKHTADRQKKLGALVPVKHRLYEYSGCRTSPRGPGSRAPWGSSCSQCLFHSWDGNSSFIQRLYGSTLKELFKWSQSCCYLHAVLQMNS